MRWFLLLCFLIPFNLFSEELPFEGGKFDDWYYAFTVDDFTDVNSHLVQTVNDESDIFGIYFREPIKWTWLIRLGNMKCFSDNEEPIPVLFRVDKNEVLTLNMKPKGGRTNLILAQNSYNHGDLLLYQFELMRGSILKIRIDDPHCEYSSLGRYDTKFSLKGFKKAYAPISKLIEEDIKERLNSE